MHLKATMMKVSDPIVFGHVVRKFFPKTFEQYGATLAAAGLSPNDGLGGIYNGLAALPEGDAIKASFDAELADGPTLARPGQGRGPDAPVEDLERGPGHAELTPRLAGAEVTRSLDAG